MPGLALVDGMKMAFDGVSSMLSFQALYLGDRDSLPASFHLSNIKRIDDCS